MLVMTLLICGAVLVVAIATLFGFQVLNFRSNFQRDATTLALIVANNSTVAMSFKDEFIALLKRHGVTYDERYLWNEEIVA